MKRAPHFPLERLKELVARPRGLFIQRERALDFFATYTEAYATVRQVILGLSPSSFAHTVQLTYDIADVYGVRVQGAGWYLKVTVDEGVPAVAVISFHPLERALKTSGGVVKP
jgi:hypothetical protein